MVQILINSSDDDETAHACTWWTGRMEIQRNYVFICLCKTRLHVDEMDAWVDWAKRHQWSIKRINSIEKMNKHFSLILFVHHSSFHSHSDFQFKLNNHKTTPRSLSSLHRSLCSIVGNLQKNISLSISRFAAWIFLSHNYAHNLSSYF